MDSREDYMWIFGYGSLLWKPNFPYIESQVGYVRNHVRRFWQGSTNHRGVPGTPGRVVTLIEKDGEVTWGASFKVCSDDIHDVLVNLYQREVTSGYVTKNLTMHTVDSDVNKINVLVYIATESNPDYLGPACEKTIAKQVVDAYGTSGPNIEYVLKLAEWMKLVVPSAKDDHLFEIEREVLKISNLLSVNKKITDNTLQ